MIILPYRWLNIYFIIYENFVKIRYVQGNSAKIYALLSTLAAILHLTRTFLTYLDNSLHLASLIYWYFSSVWRKTWKTSTFPFWKLEDHLTSSIMLFVAQTNLYWGSDDISSSMQVCWQRKFKNRHNSRIESPLSAVESESMD